jgi:acyl carrier protein
MMHCSAENVRQFIVDHYPDAWAGRNLTAERVPDSFDLLIEGVIDSLGVLELIGAVEEAFDIEIDLQYLDADQVTVIGPLSKYVEQAARSRNSPNGEEPESLSQGALG